MYRTPETHYNIKMPQSIHKQWESLQPSSYKFVLEESTGLSNQLHSLLLTRFKGFQILNLLQGILQYTLAFHQFDMITNLGILFGKSVDFI